MPNEIIKKIEPAFEDERGKISNILEEPITHIAIITSKKGAIRANHYHPDQVQYEYLISGKYESYSKDLKKKGKEADIIALIPSQIGNLKYLILVRDKKTITTLRVIPTVRDTFLSAGIKMENFDLLPNYWDTVPHNIKKRTERTRSCDVCHVDKEGFLTKETLIKDGSKANEELIYTPKPIKNLLVI